MNDRANGAFRKLGLQAEGALFVHLRAPIYGLRPSLKSSTISNVTTYPAFIHKETGSLWRGRYTPRGSAYVIRLYLGVSVLRTTYPRLHAFVESRPHIPQFAVLSISFGRLLVRLTETSWTSASNCVRRLFACPTGKGKKPPCCWQRWAIGWHAPAP